MNVFVSLHKWRNPAPNLSWSIVSGDFVSSRVSFALVREAVSISKQYGLLYLGNSPFFSSEREITSVYLTRSLQREHSNFQSPNCFLRCGKVIKDSIAAIVVDDVK